jgi:F420-0:gamma-glutamyl ligase
MGEGTECRPLALVEAQGLEFFDGCDRELLEIPVDEDLYAPIYKSLLVKEKALL